MSTLPNTSDLPPSYFYEYEGAKLIAVATAFIPLEILFVALRYYSRNMHKTAKGLDDILIAPALICCLAVDIIAISMTKYAGVGRHVLALEATDPSKVVLWAKLILAAEWAYLAAVTLPKLSILSMYLRIFTTKPYRRSAYVLGAILIMTFLAGGLTGTLGCQPLAFFWDPTIPGGHCININAFFRWISLPNILTDLAMLVLPQPLIWTLHITRTQKIGLTLTFLTGSVGLIASAFRFATFFQNNAITDGTFSSVELMSWTIIEPGIYLMAACLPPLRPLVQRIFKDTRLARLSTEWTPKHSDGPYERSPVNMKLEGHRGLRPEVYRHPPGFNRLNDGRESFSKSSDIGSSLVENCRSARENMMRLARNNCSADVNTHDIHVEHDIVVTTSNAPASRSQVLEGRIAF